MNTVSSKISLNDIKNIMGVLITIIQDKQRYGQIYCSDLCCTWKGSELASEIKETFENYLNSNEFRVEVMYLNDNKFKAEIISGDVSYSQEFCMEGGK